MTVRRCVELRLPGPAEDATEARLQAAEMDHVLEVTNAYPGGYWENGGYNWFSGV